MDSNKRKTCIDMKNWLFILTFFIFSILYGILAKTNSSLNSSLLGNVEKVLELLCYTMLIGAVFWIIYKLSRKAETVNKIWIISAIFIFFQIYLVYWFETSTGVYDIAINNVFFYNIMSYDIFLIFYIIFLLICIIRNRKEHSADGLVIKDILFFIILVLPPILCSLNLFIYSEMIACVKDENISIISYIFFNESMSNSDKMNTAEVVMDQLMRINSYLRIFYPFLIYAMICIEGVALWRENITYCKYLALGGTFVVLQYWGISYFDKLLGCFKNFSTANLNMLYQTFFNNSYRVIYVTPLIIYFMKHLYLNHCKRNKISVSS